MYSVARRAATYAAVCSALALFTMAMVAAMPGAKAWAAVSARSGGLSPIEEAVPTNPETGLPEETVGPPGKATLVGSRAVAPSNAPAAVRKVIEAANKIRTKPYIWGGGHGHWWDRGYDCSGSVSYALHGAGLLPSPLTSGSLESWGAAGSGKWITVYANGGHTYAVIAGLRWDTSEGPGPRWHTALRNNRGFVPRHPIGY
jgi:cell wall-associated NlpC family hydrolase